MRSVFLRTVALVAVATAVTGCGGSSSGSGPASNGEATKSATQILADAEAALSRVHSFHIQGSGTNLSGTPQTLSGDFELPGRLRVNYTNGNQSVSLVLTGGTGYFKANKPFWMAHTSSVRVIALLADRWFKVPATFPGFEQFASWANPATIGPCLLATHHGTISVAGTTRYAGRPAVILRDAGDVPGSSPGELYVSAAGAPLPLRSLQTGTQRPGGTPDQACGETKPPTSTAKSSQFAIGDYNKQVQIVAPPNATALSSLAGAAG